MGNKPKKKKERKEKKMNEEDLKESLMLYSDEIQDVINDFVEGEEESKKSGLGICSKLTNEKELKVGVSQKEIDKIIKELQRH